MGKIKQLSSEVIAKIAAGEIIERPAYAVKELLENAIDAHADSIKITIENSGLKKILVSDNGEGMSRDDFVEAYKSHTTSKLETDTALLGIKTLGFRGEALASIAAVSNVSIRSRLPNDPGGTLIELQAGVLQKVSSIGMPPGTTVEVTNLFQNVPARKNFLKSARTEFRHITDIILAAAIIHPHIGFYLTHNKKIILDLPKAQASDMRIQALLGKTIYGKLLPVKYEDGYVTVSGFISHPQLTTQTQNKNLLFVNTRPIADKLISLAIKHAYGNLLEATAYPVSILFLSLPYEMVDINVHPRKEQIKFIDNNFLYTTVKEGVETILSKNNLTFHNLSWKADGLYPQADFTGKKGATISHAGSILKEEVLQDTKDIAKIKSSADSIQTHTLYVITETKKGIILIDQHAASERIFYEKFLTEFIKQKQKKVLYHVLPPVSFELSLSDAQVVDEYTEVFLQCGFLLTHLKNSIFTLAAVPVLFKDRSYIELIHEMIDDLRAETLPKDIDVRTKRMVAYLACRAAIKAGDVLTKEEIKKLIKTLEITKNNYTCPHGRPTKIEISLEELHRLFKRK